MTHDERLALWRQRLEAQRASGLSIVAWCGQHDIREATFFYWRKRVAVVEAPATTPWMVLDAPSTSESGVIVQVGPATVVVTAGFDPQVLAAVVRTLATC